MFAASRSEANLVFVSYMCLSIVLASLFGLMVALGSAIRIFGTVGNDRLDNYFDSEIIFYLENFLQNIPENHDHFDMDELFEDISVELDVDLLEEEFFDWEGKRANFHVRLFFLSFYNFLCSEGELPVLARTR